MAGTYESPTWNNGTSPAINQTNLNNLGEAVEQNQSDIAALQTLTANYSTVASNAAQVPTLSSRTICVTNVAVAASAWADDATYSSAGYTCRALAAVAGASASYVPFVNYGMADALSGNYAPVAVSASGGVYIYAKEKPTTTVTIPSIVCIAKTA